ncbi:M28 family peptidase [bacterium]|nr:M28 family peptidase [bacterium]
MSRKTKLRLIFWCLLPALTVAFLGYCLVLPGRSWSGPLAACDPTLAESLKAKVSFLTRDIGERNHYTYEAQKTGRPAQLETAANWLEGEFKAMDYSVVRDTYELSPNEPKFSNVIATRAGASSSEIVVIGAHYDSVPGTPGADDNASGVAILLELAGLYRGGQRTVRFVAFTNEEPQYFQTEQMGSLVYARACRRANEQIVAMLSLETLGYYRSEPGSQKYPFPLGLLYPSTGNFIGFVSNLPSRELNHRVIAKFRESTHFPSEGACLPELIPGVSWSDHWSFGQVGYPSVMVTDTAPFRNPNYHQSTDTFDTLDYDRMALVTMGLKQVLEDLAGPSPK